MDKRNVKYSLQKYAGMKTRHECPNCHDKHSFTLYVDESGRPLSPICGRCNHEDKCGYHLTPSKFLEEHPEKRATSFDKSVFKPQPKRQQQCTFIPSKYVVQSISLRSHFAEFLKSLFPRQDMLKIMGLYKLGATQAGGVIFWQIDETGNVCNGKIVDYNPESGHRIKNTEKGKAQGMKDVDWIHSRLQKRGELSWNIHRKRCLFGQHILKMNPTATVCLTESEKTAVLGSLYFRNENCVWVSCGGVGNFKAGADYLRCLKGRSVILFPDTNFTECWRKEMESMTFAKFRIFEMDSYSNEADKRLGSDIGDWIITKMKHTSPLIRMMKKNPFLKEMIKAFDLMML